MELLMNANGWLRQRLKPWGCGGQCLPSLAASSWSPSFWPPLAKQFIFPSSSKKKKHFAQLIYTFMEMLVCGFRCYFNYIFVFAGLVDFHRRYLMLQAASVIIDPIKENACVPYRIFPTINLLDIQSLHSWFQMRQCLMDLGRKYLKRIFIQGGALFAHQKLSFSQIYFSSLPKFIYSSFFLACYLIFVIYRLLAIFDVLQSDISFLAILLSTTDCIFVLVNILLMLYFGAQANNQFVVDQLTLNYIGFFIHLCFNYMLSECIFLSQQQLLVCVGLTQLKQSLVIAKNHIKNIIGVSQQQEEIIDGEEFNGQYLTIIARQLRAYQKLKPHKTKAEIRRKLDKLIKEVDIIRERLEIEANHHPLRIMGLKATYELMNQIYTGIATIFVAVGQQAFSNGKFY